MNRPRDRFLFLFFAIVSVALAVAVVLRARHQPQHAQSAVWPTLTACAVEKHYLQGRYAIRYTPEALALKDRPVMLDGFLTPLEAGEKSTHFLLSVRAPSCPYCPPAAPNEMAEIFLQEPIAWSEQMIRLRGRLTLMPAENAEGIFFRLQEAVPVPEPAAMSAAPAEAALAAVHLQDARGHEVSLNSWRGAPVLLMFWRTDCAPCLLELHAIDAIRQAHVGRPVVLLALQPAAAIAAQADRLPRDVPVLTTQDDPRQVLAAFGNDNQLALPYSVMLDGEGKRCAAHRGILSPALVHQWSLQCASPS